MATLEELGFELERRSILFHKDTTMPDGSQLGYDGDPNLADPDNSDGEFLLHYSPSGTNYCQKTTTPFTIWTKKSDDPGGIWIVSGTGGGGEVVPQHIEAEFDFSQTDQALSIGKGTKDQKILKTILKIIEKFDNDLGVTVGTDTSQGLLMTLTENDTDIPGEYCKSNNLPVDDGTEVFRAFFSYTTQPTEGRAVVTIYFN
jgi:hypothetical protein